MANNQTSFDYSRYTPVDNTNSEYSIFKSAYKNIRFALPYASIRTVRASDMANLPGLAFELYKDVSLWRLLLAYNGVQDPIQDIYPGFVLKVPDKSDIIAYIAQQQNNTQPTVTI